RLYELSIGRIMLLFRIHELAVRFLVPPGVTEIRVHEEISLMHVAIHALARRNRAGELVHDRMSALGFRNRFVSGETQTLISELVGNPSESCGRPPFSKMRRMFPGLLRLNRGNGSMNGKMP